MVCRDVSSSLWWLYRGSRRMLGLCRPVRTTHQKKFLSHCFCLSVGNHHWVHDVISIKPQFLLLFLRWHYCFCSTDFSISPCRLAALTFTSRQWRSQSAARWRCRRSSTAEEREQFLEWKIKRLWWKRCLLKSLRKQFIKTFVPPLRKWRCNKDVEEIPPSSTRFRSSSCFSFLLPNCKYVTQKCNTFVCPSFSFNIKTSRTNQKGKKQSPAPSQDK